MLNAPQHDWSFYEAKTAESQATWFRGQTPQERFDLYASLFNTLWNARQNLPGDWERLDRQRWQQKLDLRRRIINAFQRLDERRRERSTANNAS